MANNLNEFNYGCITAEIITKPLIDYLNQKNSAKSYSVRYCMFKSGDSVDTFEIMEKAPEGIRKIFPKKIARISFSTWDFLCKSTIYDNELISKEDLERLVFSEDSRKKREQIILNTHTTI